MHGTWHNPDLAKEHRGSLSTDFLPDGRVYLGPPRHQPPARETSTITLQAGGYSNVDRARRVLAR